MFSNETPKHSCRLRVGTSGYSYAEWVNAGFYPPGTRSGQMLPLYAQTFPITELNFTWYQMPKAAAIERLRQRAPSGFRFAAKLTRTLTHEVDPSQWRGQVSRYRDGMAPLAQARQLTAVLLQFPPSFPRARTCLPRRPGSWTILKNRQWPQMRVGCVWGLAIFGLFQPGPIIPCTA